MRNLRKASARAPPTARRYGEPPSQCNKGTVKGALARSSTDTIELGRFAPPGGARLHRASDEEDENLLALAAPARPERGVPVCVFSRHSGRVARGAGVARPRLPAHV